MEENLLAKKIADELLNFYIVRNTTKVETTLTFQKEATLITLKGDLKVAEREIQKLADCLKESRNPSLEIYYQELLGTSHHELSDYTLIGMMTDEVTLSYQDMILEIQLVRKK